LNLVDSSGWIEFFVDGPNAGWFARPINETRSLIVPTISLLEVYKYVVRARDREGALQVVANMRQGNVVELDEGLAIEAADLGATHGLLLADSIIYATAAAFEATLWTQDSDFEGLAGVEYRPKLSGNPDR
jgi:predicted nucleic acid-binding protein